ncbi:hypothetical protein [Leptospira sp. severe_002]|uniref:hypothetical protein n=1 Tax=Leptospira sp. severe_002 TaxID=2838237 RepID=UPI001E4522DA|nr:hypothetical protein [Leptospira sp. severe_002]
MWKIATAAVLALSLAACDAVDTVKEGFSHAKDVENDILVSTGVKPSVGFNWNNGRLRQVTVMFPGLYETKPLHDLGQTVRASVEKQFKQTPDQIVLAFALPK